MQYRACQEGPATTSRAGPCTNIPRATARRPPRGGQVESFGPWTLESPIPGFSCSSNILEML